MKRVARLLGAVVLASAAGCGSQGNPEAPVDAGTQIGVFSNGTTIFSGAFAETDQAIAFAKYDNFVGAVPSDGGTFVYLQLSDAIGINFHDTTGPSYYCAFTFTGTSLQPGHYTPADVIDFSCGVIVGTDAGVVEFWTQSTFVLDITATGPVRNSGGTPYWNVPTATLSAQLVAVDDLNPTDAGLSFTSTVAPPDCTISPYLCFTY